MDKKKSKKRNDKSCADRHNEECGDEHRKLSEGWRSAIALELSSSIEYDRWMLFASEVLIPPDERLGVPVLKDGMWVVYAESADREAMKAARRSVRDWAFGQLDKLKERYDGDIDEMVEDAVTDLEF